MSGLRSADDQRVYVFTALVAHLDLHDLRFALADLDHLALLLAEERVGERRDVGERALRRIGFVLADDLKRLFAAPLEFGASRSMVTREPKRTMSASEGGGCTSALALRCVQ